MTARSIFPEGRDVSAPRELAAERLHRGVRRDDHELLAGGCRTDGAVDRAAPWVDDLDALLRHAGVLEAVREIARADPRHDDVLDRWRERLEVRVPDPGHVAPIGVLVVERREQPRPATRLKQRANGRV